MITIAKSSTTEREVLFGNAAEKADIRNPAIVEKDFWVCLHWTICFISRHGLSHSSLRAVQA